MVFYNQVFKLYATTVTQDRPWLSLYEIKPNSKNNYWKLLGNFQNTDYHLNKKPFSSNSFKLTLQIRSACEAAGNSDELPRLTKQ